MKRTRHPDATPRHAGLDTAPDWPMVEDWECDWPPQEDWMESDRVGQPLHVERMDKMGNTISEHWTEDNELQWSIRLDTLLVHLREEQQKDEFMGAIIRFLEGSDLPSDEKQARWVKIKVEQCEIVNGALQHHIWPQRGVALTRTMTRVAVPGTLIKVVLQAHHDDLLGGHLGRN